MTIERLVVGAAWDKGSASSEVESLAWGVLDRAFSRPGTEVLAVQSSLMQLMSLVSGRSAEQSDRHFDLSIRLLDPEDALAGAALARDWPMAPLGDLAGTSGLVLTGLTSEEALTTRSYLHGRGGLEVSLSPVVEARIDVFARVPGQRPGPALRSYLQILGPGEEDELSASDGSVASGLQPRTAELLVARFPGLVAVPRAFQRFDIHLTGPGLLSPTEAGDFLASRGRAHPGRVAPGQVVCAECQLNREAAQLFLRDYREIGIPAELRLCGLGSNG